ncbi:hypothetical protein Zmor_022669 [Zophobas morio]|uniref:STING ligand-binding domain-containing protein n=1 Tax=Zophobas morio TaxID=2755281 RepID=A0AA38HWI3_9CUCU|nr:hypothetical protein Zmor_022669 [Zophobas morio]
MTPLRQQLILKLEKLDKNDLIDLLLLPKSGHKCEHFRSLKSEIDALNSNAVISDNTLSAVLSRNAQNQDCDRCIEAKRIKLEETLHLRNDKYNKTDSLDTIVGVYMAYSIFHGYLNLVIPRTGTTEPHLQELMQDYEATNGVKFACYKLFLLIPKSTYCPTTLEEASKRITKCDPLPEKLITRAGVQDRSYKNSVYKILNWETEKSTYVVAEYATPVKTYKDVLTYNYGEDSDAYKKNKDKVVLKFNLALQKILQEHENCTNYCELVYYDDKNENGSLKDLADVLTERIEALKIGDTENYPD